MSILQFKFNASVLWKLAERQVWHRKYHSVFYIAIEFDYQSYVRQHNTNTHPQLKVHIPKETAHQTLHIILNRPVVDVHNVQMTDDNDVDVDESHPNFVQWQSALPLLVHYLTFVCPCRSGPEK